MVAFCSSTLPDRPMMGMKTPKPSAWQMINIQMPRLASRGVATELIRET